MQQHPQLRHLGRPRLSSNLPVTSLGLESADAAGQMVLPIPLPPPLLLPPPPQPQAHWRYLSVLDTRHRLPGRTEFRTSFYQHPQIAAGAPPGDHHNRRRSSRSAQKQQPQHPLLENKDHSTSVWPSSFPVSQVVTLASEKPPLPPPLLQAQSQVPGFVDETEARLLLIRQKLSQLSLQQEQAELLAASVSERSRQQQLQHRQQQRRSGVGGGRTAGAGGLPVRARLAPTLRPHQLQQRPRQPRQLQAPEVSETFGGASEEVELLDEEEDDDDDCEADAGAENDEEIDGIAADAADDAGEDEDVLDCLDDEAMSGCGSISNGGTGAATSLLASRRPSAGGAPSGPRQPAIIPSLFPYVPSVLRFAAESDLPPEQLPWELRRQLKWRMSSITPVVVKRAVARSGFRAAKKSHEWLGYFGKHMKPEGFRGIREYQKVNHIPGSFSIGRKDRLWRSLHRMQCHHGRKEFGYFPQTYLLPADLKQLRRAWEDAGPKQKWIVKPPAAARGIGIRVVNKWQKVPKRRSAVVQTYLAKPYLINGSKFDLRVYVYVTSLDPLRIYVHERGLVRFASVQYSHSSKTIGNRFMHLTNYSVNKRNSAYTSGDAERDGEGHKWTLRALWAHLRQAGHDPDRVWESVKDLAVKTIISGEAHMNSQVKAFCRRRYCAHELFGFDVLLDEQLKPWLLEVNISPSLHSNSQLDVDVKSAMIRDMMNLAGFQVPDPTSLSSSSSSASASAPGSAASPTPTGSSSAAAASSSDQLQQQRPYADRRCWPEQWPTTSDERAKKLWFIQRADDRAAAAAILDQLTADDVRVLVESLDEFTRAGEFIRVFPVADEAAAQRYLGLMEQPRYYNLLLLQHLLRYRGCESQGVEALAAMCRRRVHLEASPGEAWSPPRRF